jgi:hypothetical protein
MTLILVCRMLSGRRELLGPLFWDYKFTPICYRYFDTIIWLSVRLRGNLSFFSKTVRQLTTKNHVLCLASSFRCNIISRGLWHRSSPDLNPSGLCLWDILQDISVQGQSSHWRKYERNHSKMVFWALPAKLRRAVQFSTLNYNCKLLL